MSTGIPKNYGECLNTPRPCLHFTCKWHTFSLLGKDETRRLNKDARGDKKIIARILSNETCILDIAQEEEQTLEQIAVIMNCSRENVRLLEARGLAKMQLHRKKQLR